MIGLWSSYLIMCFVFAYHISTHDYYHLILVPIVALSLGPISSAIIGDQSWASKKWLERVSRWAVLLIAFFLTAGTSIQAERKQPEELIDLNSIQMIGELLHHSTEVIILEPFYGYPTYYHGALAGISWPYRYDIVDEGLWDTPIATAEERFKRLNADRTYDFFVIMDLEEYESQNDLRQFLNDNFSIMANNNDHLIFDLRQPGNESDAEPEEK